MLLTVTGKMPVLLTVTGKMPVLRGAAFFNGLIRTWFMQELLDFLTRFGLAFVPIFVAVDAVGILPIYIGLADGIEPQVRTRVVRQAMVTALVVGVGFTFLGKELFRLIGVTVADFKIAGGVMLFLIAAVDVVSERRFTRQITTLGAVPLGIPLIVGPAVLTTSIIMVGVHGYAVTVAALVVNILLAGVLLFFGGHIFRLFGQAGSRAVTKVAALILAAFAVMMIRSGVLETMATALVGSPP